MTFCERSLWFQLLRISWLEQELREEKFDYSVFKFEGHISVVRRNDVSGAIRL